MESVGLAPLRGASGSIAALDVVGVHLDGHGTMDELNADDQPVTPGGDALQVSPNPD
jgi:hypothetical protein